MNFFKKLFVILLSLVLLLFVCACDNNNAESVINSGDDINTNNVEIKTDETGEITFVGDDSRITKDLTLKLIGNMSSDSDEKANSLRDEIVYSKDTIKAKGTTYYVSNSGSDTNDGTSPEKAWRSLNGVNTYSYNFKEGDAVLFERGGVFRGSLKTVSGVSYGAYGEGQKPCIYGSKKNYAKEQWRRTSEDNIYALVTTVADVGTIVFNHGEYHGVKKLNKVFECEKDFDFFHDTSNGLLYVYCSKGRPDEVFYDIELLEKIEIISVPKNSTNVYIENLCVKYGGAHAISMGRPVENITIKNCEIGWIGGSIMTEGTQTRYGNGIQFYGDSFDSLIDHNWIYQCYDTGITHQYHSSGDSVVENITYTKNLIEYCSMSFEYFWHNTDRATGKYIDTEKTYMKNILVSENIMRFAGYGFGKQRPTQSNSGHIVSWSGINRSDNFVISNNIFDISVMNIFTVFGSDTSYLPLLKENTYIQDSNARLGTWYKNEIQANSAQSVIKQIDKNATLVVH